MYLKRIITVNYRSCKFIDILVNDSEPNIFIGINDCGKSTILNAINLLLDPKGKFNFVKDDKLKNDLSNSRMDKAKFNAMLDKNKLIGLEYDEDRAFIIGEFQIEEGDLDEFKPDRFSNHLAWVLENNHSNNIWYAKEFLDKESLINEYLLTPDYMNEEGVLARLYDSKDNHLRKIIKEKGISSDDIENENKKGRYKKVELFRAIYAKNREELNPYWSEYSHRAKETVFPKCEYLDWNLSFDQLLEFTSNIIKTEIGDEISAAERAVKKQAENAQKIVNDKLAHFTQQFRDDLPNVVGFKANLNLQVQSQLTDFLINKVNSDGDIHLDQQGEGVKRQIWFALLKWKAFSSIDSGIKHNKFIWCFDEPETHLYPKAQREFFDIIKKANNGNVQTFIGTHSTVFIDKAKVANITRVELLDGYSNLFSCETVEKIYEALQIRNSDFLFYDKFLIVEGDTEEYLFPLIYHGIYNESLLESGIQLINLGGIGKVRQNKLILERVLSGFNKKDDQVRYVFDNDVKFGGLDREEISKMNPIFLGRQDFEDSFSAEFWHRLVSKEFPELEIKLKEIANLIDNIPDNKKINSNQKFYKKLKNKLKKMLSEDQRNLVDDKLPSKGKQSAELLYSYMDVRKDVCSELLEVFEDLRK